MKLTSIGRALALAGVLLLPLAAQSTQFTISFPASAHAQPITGRVFVILSKTDTPEPRLQVSDWLTKAYLFGAGVSRLQPGQAAVINGETLGYPASKLAAIPAGDYYVPGLVNIYTEFPRSDGHTIWAHMDHWGGQQFNRAPENLYSKPVRVHLDPAQGYRIALSLDQVIPPVAPIPDTAWVKRIKRQSPMLSKFWGHPIYYGAIVLLPRGYATHPHQYYPVLYQQGHFSLRPPFGFRTTPPPAATGRFGRFAGRGYDFYKAWNAPNFPRFIVVTFQHPTPYYDDSYAVNSANNGPYGDAIMQELIPYIETHYRIIRKPWARLLQGGSTGGWEALALEAYHPNFFGGTWVGFPDPVDFRYYQSDNIYTDKNAFFAPTPYLTPAVRAWQRTPDGQVINTMQQDSQYEEVLGSHGRSDQQLGIWQAAWGPVGPDGYPVDLWNFKTGVINHQVADYMRDHGYDLRYYLQQHWGEIGKDLVGKIHVYVGDMDSYYLNLAVYDLQDFLDSTKDPAAQASFAYGRPMKGHGWTPVSSEEMIREMAAYIQKHKPTS
ncbi:MAG: alpha/beta hydrolase-fold protein [Terriglobales bacterium]